MKEERGKEGRSNKGQRGRRKQITPDTLGEIETGKVEQSHQVSSDTELIRQTKEAHSYCRTSAIK